MKINNDSKMAFQRNILVKNIPIEKGEIGHLAVACAQKAGLYKGEAISTQGTQVGKNNFLIVDPNTLVGKLFLALKEVVSDYSRNSSSDRFTRGALASYDKALEDVVKSAKKINYEG